MPKCIFCSKTIKEGRGFTLVSNDFRLHHFCSSKCYKNWKIGRDAKNLKWIKKQKKINKKQ